MEAWKSIWILCRMHVCDKTDVVAHACYAHACVPASMPRTRASLRHTLSLFLSLSQIKTQTLGRSRADCITT